MSEPVQQAENAPEAQQEPAQEAEAPKTYDEAYVANLRQEAAKYRTKLREEEQARRASMTDTERAIAEARESAASEVRSQYGQRLAQTEFKAAAAARNSGYDVAKALQYVDLAKFVGEDGEPNSKAIAAAVADLVPEANAGPLAPPSFDGGTRQPATGAPSMSQLIRQAAGRA